MAATGAIIQTAAARATPERRVRELCGSALIVAAALHVVVGFEHSGSNFGALALAAGVGQLLLSAAVLRGPSGWSLQLAIISGLMLIQLYVVNVTIGLPPLIAHSHVGGTHQLWGFTLAWPGVVEWQGIAAKATEALSVGCAAWLRRA